MAAGLAELTVCAEEMKTAGWLRPHFSKHQLRSPPSPARAGGWREVTGGQGSPCRAPSARVFITHVQRVTGDRHLTWVSAQGMMGT